MADPIDLIDTDSDLTPSELEELRRLSPASVLAKAPVAPVGVPQMPTREELIQQAAKASAVPFSLPAADQITPSPALQQMTMPAQAAQPGAPVSNIIIDTPAPLPPAKPLQPAASLPPQSLTPAAQPPMAQQPVMTVATPPQKALSPDKAAAAVRPSALGETSLERARKMRIRIVLGSLAFVLIAFGVVALLSFTGTRIPALYTAMHGLPTTGTAVAEQARQIVLNYETYSVTADLRVVEVGTSAAAASASPTTSPTAETSPDITSDLGLEASPEAQETPSAAGSSSATAELSTKYDKLTFEKTEEQFTGSGTFAINQSNQPTAFTLRAPLEGQWTLRATAETTIFDTVPGSEIRKTLLQPALEPVPFASVLSAAGAETSYTFVRNDGGTYAQYSYAVRPQAVAAYLPSGMTISPTSRIDAWFATSAVQGSELGAITASRLRLDVSYEGKDYTITQTLLPVAFGDESVALSTALDEQLLGTTGEAATEGDAESFVNGLGLFLTSVPNTLGDEALGEEPVDVTPEVSPTPTASALASPSASPTATSTASPSVSATPSPTATPFPASITTPIDAVALPAPVPTETNIVTLATLASRRSRDIATIAEALERYREANGRYPISLNEVQLQADTPVFSALVSTYLDAMPIDPKPTAYYYGYRSDGNWFVVTAISEGGATGEIVGARYNYIEVRNK